jgi:hypothetical protein
LKTCRCQQDILKNIALLLEYFQKRKGGFSRGS